MTKLILDELFHIFYIESTSKYDDTLFKVLLYKDNEYVGSYLYSVDVDRCGYIESFLVIEKHLGLGYGKIMANSVKELSKRFKISSAFLHSKAYEHKRLDDTKLILFYEKHLNANIINATDEFTYMGFEIEF